VPRSVRRVDARRTPITRRRGREASDEFRFISHLGGMQNGPRTRMLPEIA
jgi:hypothetical protein